MSRLRILLVEDHEDTLRSMERLLREKHVVHSAQSIAAALDAAGAHSFDLVICDLGLPDGSGIDLMSALRDKHNLRGICLSGYALEDDVLRSKRAGFVHHLIKPIDVQQLEKIIDSL